MTPDDFDKMDMQELQRKITELEARFTARAASPISPAPAPAPAPARRQDQHRQVFFQIALLCKGALAQPPFGCLHRQDLLDIARLCKRALERED
jgi:hypothetical protein